MRFQALVSQKPVLQVAWCLKCKCNWLTNEKPGNLVWNNVRNYLFQITSLMLATHYKTSFFVSKSLFGITVYHEQNSYHVFKIFSILPVTLYIYDLTSWISICSIGISKISCSKINSISFNFYKLFCRVKIDSRF